MSSTTTNGVLPAAGWYADPQDAAQLRWWDGSQWTAHSTPAPQADAAAVAPEPVAEQAAVPRYGEYVPQEYPAQPYAAQPSAPQAAFAQPSFDQAVFAQPAYVPADAARSAAAQPFVVQSYSAQPYATSPGRPTVAEGTPTAGWQIWGMALLPIVSMILLFTWDVESYFRMMLAAPAEADISLMMDPGYLLVTFGSWALAAAMIVFAVLDWRWLGRQGYPQRFHWAWAILGSMIYIIGRAVVVKRQAGKGLAPMWTAIIVNVLSIVVTVVWMIQMMDAIFNGMLLPPGIAS